MPNIGIAHFKKRLEDELTDLTTASTSGAAGRRTVELDQQSVGRVSRIDALQSQAMSLETERRRQLRIQKLKSALERLENGDFGYCVTCDEEIAPARLDLDPAATTCINCASGK